MIDQELLLIVKSSELGQGEVDLGAKLLVNMFKVLSESNGLPAKIIFVNSGIFLTTEGSLIAESIKILESRGTEILTCGTCLDYYGRKDRLVVGRPTNMNDTVRAMLGCKKVITL